MRRSISLSLSVHKTRNVHVNVHVQALEQRQFWRLEFEFMTVQFELKSLIKIERAI